MLQFFWVIISLVIAIISLLLLFTGEVQGPLNCLLDPGEVQHLKLKMGALKGEQARYDQLENKVVAMKKEIKSLEDQLNNEREKNEILTAKNHDLAEENRNLELEKAILTEKLHGESQKNKELTGKSRVLQQNYDALGSHCAKEEKEKAKLEKDLQYWPWILLTVYTLLILLAIGCCCFCCIPNKNEVNMFPPIEN